MGTSPGSSNNGVSGGGILDAFKTTIASPVGGWVLACGAFAMVTYWSVQDRAHVYAENLRIRADAMHTIEEVQKLIVGASSRALENNELIRDVQKVNDDSNRILREVRSMMDLPRQNREDIKKTLKLLEEEKEREGITP
jgi:hypothetical protein